MRNTISEPISPAEGSMIFSEPLNEPPSPTYTPVFSPLEEEEDEVKEAITTHTTMELIEINKEIRLISMP